MNRRFLPHLSAFLCTVCATGPLAAQEPSAVREARGEEAPITTRLELEATAPRSANPYLSFLPAGVEPDYRYWTAKLRFDSWDRAAASPPKAALGTPFAESEDNDSYAAANALPGLLAGGPPLTITGATDTSPTFFPPISGAESGACSNDSPGAATSIGSAQLNSGARVEINGAIGDCASGSGDFDYYSFFLSQGDTVAVQLDEGAGLTSLVWIFGESPHSLLDLADSDPYGSGSDVRVSTSAPASGTYWMLVHSLSGTGSYDAWIGKNVGLDVFSVELEAGDVIGVASDVVTELSIVGPDFVERFGTALALNDFYPAGSPLPMSATGSEVSDVARESGTHFLRVRSVSENTAIPYELQAQIFRPGTEGSVSQHLYIDFDGETIDADALFGSGPDFQNATLSPLSSFLTAWGLAAGDEDAVIDGILATIEENLSDLETVHAGVSFQLSNSRDDPDTFGAPGVSRVIIGGTQEQLGRETIGVASAIDPGNFGLEDTAVVLLDLLSGPSTSLSSLNHFELAPGASQIGLVAIGVGNIASHEIGHFLGDWHTERQNGVQALVDNGGDLENILGSNDDIFGDSDDKDVDFAADDFTAGSLLRGVEDQAGRTAWALTGLGLLFADGFESGDTSAWSVTAP